MQNFDFTYKTVVDAATIALAAAAAAAVAAETVAGRIAPPGACSPWVTVLWTSVPTTRTAAAAAVVVVAARRTLDSDVGTARSTAVPFATPEVARCSRRKSPAVEAVAVAVAGSNGDSAARGGHAP